MVNEYVPERGEIVHLNFNPQTGSEQAGKRPAIVLSPKKYNQKTGLAIFCPITKISKDYPFEVSLSPRLKTKGVVLADQIKSLDWKSRKAKRKEKISPDQFSRIIEKIEILLFE